MALLAVGNEFAIQFTVRLTTSVVAYVGDSQPILWGPMNGRRISSLTTAAVAAMLSQIPSVAAYDVKEIGSFHVGGQAVKLEGLPKLASGDPNGDFHTGQMYVQYVKLKESSAKYPLLMWHTGGVTGASWETKPDGKPGWMQFFLQRGHDVFVSDAVERGRATFSRFPEIYKSEPIFRDKKEAWEIFRIGVPGSYASDPAQRKSNPGIKFPLNAFDTMQMQMAPRWGTNGPATQDAYNALVRQACPCVIMAHGQAGNFAFRAAMANPDIVKGIVAIEPAFAPKPNDPAIAGLKAIPHIFVWGDFIDTNPIWVDHVRELQAYHNALKTAGVNTEWLDLPAAGIRGNTHMPMMDTNSDEIAGRVQAWLNKNKLMRSSAKLAEPVAPRKATNIGQKTRVRTVRTSRLYPVTQTR